MTTPPAPHPGCYWVVPGKILAGNYPGEADPSNTRKKLSTILDAGVRCFINLMEGNESNRAGVPFTPYKDIVDSLASERGFTLKHRRRCRYYCRHLRSSCRGTLWGGSYPQRLARQAIQEGAD